MARAPPTQVRAPVTVVTRTGSGGHRDRVETAGLCTAHVVLRLLGAQTHGGKHTHNLAHHTREIGWVCG